ncbi:MAG TPA: ATP-binding protein [Herbaspirillum sp.]|jgi:PAS domain S-box-containing protein
MADQFEEFSSPESTAPVRLDAGAIDERERYRYLLANTPAIIYSSVPSGDFKMTFVSENAAWVLGFQPEEMIADPNFWFDHIHPEDAPAIFQSLAQLFTEGQRTYEYRFRTADGDYLWMHDTLRLIRDGNGHPLEVIGSLTDITERKRMEEALQKKGAEQLLLIQRVKETQEQLLQSEKMASLGQLAAGMAHEINNPISFVSSNMTALRTYVETLILAIDRYEATWAGSANMADIAGELRKIRQQADIDYVKADAGALLQESLDGLKRVKDIVQSLKDFSHVGESGWQMADLHKGLNSTLDIIKVSFNGRIFVERRYGNLPLVKCLASELNQVFLSLLTNAAHAIEESGSIVIETQRSGDWVSISIADTGCGIAPDHLKRIFEPFFTTKPVGSGTGLGLSLSYGIVQRHRGRIEVASTPGIGSAFTVWLPLDPEQDALIIRKDIKEYE